MANPGFVPPSALEVAEYEPEVFPSDAVEEALKGLEDLWRDEFDATIARIFDAWDEIARGKGCRDTLDAAQRATLTFEEVQAVTDEEWGRTLDELAASGRLFAYSVTMPDGGEREITEEERREFAGRVLSRRLQHAFRERREAAVVALRAVEVPAGVPLVHREFALRGERAEMARIGRRAAAAQPGQGPPAQASWQIARARG